MKNTMIRFTRRILPAALALLMASGAVFADEISVEREPGFSNFSRKQDYTVGHFSDVKAQDWFESGVKSVFELGLMNGKTASSFVPGDSVKLSEAISMAAKTHDIYNGGDGTLPAADSSHWYGDAVNYAIQNQIIKENDFINYDADATRAQLAYIFSGAVPAETLAPVNAVSSVPDITKNTPYADDILTLYRAGVVSGGDSSGTYYPQQSITRGEAASILSRIAVPSRRISFELNDPTGAGSNSDPAGAADPGSSSDPAADGEKTDSSAKDQTGSDSSGDEPAAEPVAYSGADGSFDVTVPAGTAVCWTTAPAVSANTALNLVRYDEAAPAASSRTSRKLPWETGDEYSGVVIGSLMGFVVSRQEAAAPTEIYHNLTVKSLARELSTKELIHAVYFTLAEGSGAYISPLLAGNEENAWYWIMTVEDGEQFVTLVARASRAESTELQNEILTVMKTLDLN